MTKKNRANLSASDKMLISFADAILDPMRKAWGIGENDEHTNCADEAAKGVVYIVLPSGKKVPLAYEDEEKTVPMVSPCIHAGFDLVVDYIAEVVPLVAVMTIIGQCHPLTHENFIWVADVAEDTAEVTEMDDAIAIINKVKGGAV